MHLRHILILASLAALGCGPPKLGSSPTEDSDSGEGGSDTTSTTSTSTSTTSSDTSETESESTTDWTTVDFIPDEDVQVVTECDPFLQDCPEGEKCVPYGSTGGNWDAFKCVPVMGDGKPGEPCTWGGVVEATDDCDETSACWDVMEIDGEVIGICHQFCRGTADNPECPPGSGCLISGSGTVALCIFGCDPLLQDCGAGLACYWANGNFNCIFTTEDLPPGAPCGFINDCAAGHFCATAEALPSCEGPACCTLFCNLEQGDQQCEALPGTSCVSLFEEGQAIPGYELVGICVLPDAP